MLVYDCIYMHAIPKRVLYAIKIRLLVVYYIYVKTASYINIKLH